MHGFDSCYCDTYAEDIVCGVCQIMLGVNENGEKNNG